MPGISQIPTGIRTGIGKFGSGKSLGTGIGKNWYRKKVSELVSEKFGTEKSTGIGIGSIWYWKKCRYHLKFWVLSHSADES